MLNVQLDRRHDRRALSTEEFSRLIEAAESGKPKICIPGPDRAMMYILAAWTGYRKGEIGSLTKRSLKLDESPQTVTVGVYTHIGLMDQAEAIETLPPPPPLANGNGNGRANGNGSAHSETTSPNTVTGSVTPGVEGERNGGAAESDEEPGGKEVPVWVPSGAENGAVRLASPEYQSASVCTETGSQRDRKSRSARGRKLANGREFCTDLHQSAPPGRALHRATEQVRPAGFEPATLGSEDRCAIQLRHGRAEY